MVEWNFKELRESRESRISGKDLDRLNLYTNSFHWKSMAIHKHLSDAESCFDLYMNLSNQKYDEFVSALIDGNISDDFYNAKFIREISLVSAVATAHTLPEVMAQVITIALGLKFDKLRYISSKNVIKKMPDSELKERYSKLVTSDSYNYINAFSNMSKHVCLVKPMYTIDIFAGEYHGVKFDSFEYECKCYPAMLDKDLIGDIYNFRKSCVEVGSLINLNAC
ncbi:hypothetical protein J9098_004145 [Vibrio vulnificus]|nr:hypothetical protein [Vibrio vulnificus]